MKCATSVILLAGLFVASAGPVRAEADGPDFFRVVGVAANDVLNIRAEPSSRSARIGAVPHDGNGLRNLGCRGGLTFEQFNAATPAEREAGRKTRWCRIEYRGITGWVAGWYLGEGNRP